MHSVLHSRADNPGDFPYRPSCADSTDTAAIGGDQHNAAVDVTVQVQLYVGLW